MKANPNRIVSPARTAAVGHDQHGWSASEREIKELMGLPKKLPKEAVAPKLIQGVWVYVKAAEPKIVKDTFRGPRIVKSSKHRVLCVCPQCGWEGSVGRLAQHKCREVEDLITRDYIRTGVLPG